MTPGDVVLANLPDVTGSPPKVRPALYLAPLPGPYQTHLLVGISTQQQRLISKWDEVISPSDGDFKTSGLKTTSVLRLSYLRGVRLSEVVGVIGFIDPARLVRLRQRLSDHLRP